MERTRASEDTVCLLARIKLLLQGNLNLRILDRPVRLLTGIKLLLQFNLKLWILDRSDYLLTGVKLLLHVVLNCGYSTGSFIW